MQNNTHQLEAELSETCKDLVRTQRQLKQTNTNLQLILEAITECAKMSGVEIKTVEDVQKFMKDVTIKLDGEIL